MLAVAGVRGTVAATVNAAEPWGLSLHAVPGAAFHAITDGTAWLRISERPDAVGPPDIRLMPGDVVLLPAGAAHTLASAPDVATEPFDHLAARQALTAGDELTVGTGTVQTRILCASYRQDPAVTLPLLTLLPDVVHVPAHAQRQAWNQRSACSRTSSACPDRAPQRSWTASWTSSSSRSCGSGSRPPRNEPARRRG